MSGVGIEVVTGIPADVIPLAGGVVFGRGRARYRRADVAGQLQRFARPVTVRALQGGALVGCCVLDRRELQVAGAPALGVYRALLCVADAQRGQGIGRRIAQAAMTWADAQACEADRPVVSYGLIDADNAASLHVLRSVGASDVGGIAACLRYRQWPRRRRELQIDASASCDIDDDCAWRDATPNGGAQRWVDPASGIAADAVVSQLQFDTLGRFNDALVRTLVTPFPFAHRRFDPRAFRYVSLTRVQVPAHARSQWPVFLDSLLAMHGTHYALLPIDPQRPVAERLGLAKARASLRLFVRRHGGDDRPLPHGAIGLYPVDL